MSASKYVKKVWSGKQSAMFVDRIRSAQGLEPLRRSVTYDGVTIYSRADGRVGFVDGSVGTRENMEIIS